MTMFLKRSPVHGVLLLSAVLLSVAGLRACGARRGSGGAWRCPRRATRPARSRSRCRRPWAPGRSRRGCPPDQQAGVSHAPSAGSRMDAAARAGEAGYGNQATAEAAARERASGSDSPFTELTWDELYELDLETGEPPPLLEALDGQPVMIPGFMVPLDDAATTVREFLLVPYAGACIHVPPPPANQIVHVTMVDGYEADVMWWDPIWVRGALHIDDVEHAFGSASYRMEGLETEIYDFGAGVP